MIDMRATNLMTTMEDLQALGKIDSPYNSTFIASIPKNEESIGFNQYRTISLCN